MKKLYVGNLPYNTTEADLEAYFAEAGDVESMKIITDRDTGRSKGFGFVEFVSEDSVQQALELDGKEFSGRPLKINLAREKTDRRSGGGGGGKRW